MIEEAYVSFDVAELLKEKGFDEPIRCWYDNFQDFHEEGVRMSNSDCLPPSVMCPTQAMAMAWLRKVHNKHCDIGYDIDLDWFFQIIDLKETIEYDYPETKRYHTENDTGFNTYEEAVEAALRYTLENLI